MEIVQAQSPNHEIIMDEARSPSRRQFQNRVPFRYSPSTGKVFVGHPFYYHYNITEDPQFDRSLLGNVRDGYVWLNHGTIDWYNGLPLEDYEQEAVRRGLSNHLGISLTDQDDSEYGNHNFWDEA